MTLGAIAQLKICQSDNPIDFKLIDFKVTVNNSYQMGTISSPEKLKLKHLINAIKKDLGNLIPEDLTIALNELFILAAGDGETTKYLISLNLGTSINLSNLPLVGKEFSGDRTVAIDDLKILYASRDFEVNNSIPELAEKIQSGIYVSASMKFGGDKPYDFQIDAKDDSQIDAKDDSKESNKSADKSGGANDGNGSSQNDETKKEDKLSPQTSDGIKWVDLKKNFGPVYIKRVGAHYKQSTIVPETKTKTESEIWFHLDASISGGGLSIILDGLAVGSPISNFKPKFSIDGLGINYEVKGEVSIGGSLLRNPNKDEYSGAIIIKTEVFTISAIGSYTTTEEGHPSLFIYGVLDKLIGGPPCFFVTGIAVGFGYNRQLILPTLDEIPSFPLVEAAIGIEKKEEKKPEASKEKLDELIEIQRKLLPKIPPKVGQMFFAVGIRFTSFNIVDTFLLMVVNIGDLFSIDVIGISTITSPPLLPEGVLHPLAKVRLAVLSRFIPSEGTLKVDGKILPNSYIFDPDCHLTGGFAFYTWFTGEHADDFVLTLGGYHPAFTVPPHYPKVEPLAINWCVDSELTIKGNAYYALTASAIMAGGRLEAVWQSGNQKAWFIANANFIMAWQPYSYDAEISLSIGASYTFDVEILWIRIHNTISIDVGANLHIWGPKFSGTATIDLSIISLTIAFGDRSQKKPDPLNWDDFKKSFLPDDKEVCSIAIKSGLIRQMEDNDKKTFIVNPKELVLTTASVIPIKTLESGLSQKTEPEVEPDFGIAPMNVKTISKSTYKISIQKDGKDDVSSKFEPTRIGKNVPKGLWGVSNSIDLKQPRLIENVLSGYTIEPKIRLTSGETQAIDLKQLGYHTTTVGSAYQWQSFSTFSNISAQTDDINSKSVQKKRDSLLQSLGLLNTDIDLEKFIKEKEQAFIISPQLQAVQLQAV